MSKCDVPMVDNGGRGAGLIGSGVAGIIFSVLDCTALCSNSSRIAFSSERSLAKFSAIAGGIIGRLEADDTGIDADG